ncbi:uncharacterized protein Z518_11244 [Rhinocladiella mackenziei CBS 650.93]|uniref:Alpha-L-rhamnosidase C-terminal domain-containing protein n=1 Tax=Rhinocladiella mackenziei CBS 650.93 TaxID=1442369 RepID=A0A0D2I8H9_9EURO|nr:uncharacterized protein Z518_11244 [Rhinocladiella mackenziei CBS 650.93]KIW99505.1 hypothetical protein Z518_11244 [Rhinocladiella mackenziei CBS 650.93]
MVWRWTPFGAPAPETANTMSPLFSSFELQAHYIAGQPARAMELMRRMSANFMLDDPCIANSTFIEGYASDRMLHYAPYDDDARISHAHGWATGPTSALTFHVAGLSIVSTQGKTWVLKPSPGDLEWVGAGFTTGPGTFAAKYELNGDGWPYWFQTPEGTSGSLSVETPNAWGC